MRILYVVRDRSSRSIVKRLHRWSTGFLDGQDGFFEAALHRAGNVTRRTLAEAQALAPSARRQFDAVVVNAKAGHDVDAPSQALTLARMTDGPVALFLGNARAAALPSEAAVAPYDVLFKREPWADRNRYDLTPRNQDKIVPTHLSNPLAVQSYRMDWHKRTRHPHVFGWEATPRYDVFFLGAKQRVERFPREDSWARVVDAGFDHAGGLFSKTPLPTKLLAKSLPRKTYLDTMLGSRVNLGLEGIGSFTFRHLEILWAGGFLLSNPTVPEQQLRTPLVEGQDYVAFSNHDDMIDKIRHYAHPNQDQTRKEIARAGRAAYERLHDVEAHAKEIRAALSR